MGTALGKLLEEKLGFRPRLSFRLRASGKERGPSSRPRKKRGPSSRPSKKRGPSSRPSKKRLHRIRSVASQYSPESNSDDQRSPADAVKLLTRASRPPSALPHACPYGAAVLPGATEHALGNSWTRPPSELSITPDACPARFVRPLPIHTAPVRPAPVTKRTSVTKVAHATKPAPKLAHPARSAAPRKTRRSAKKTGPKLEVPHAPVKTKASHHDDVPDGAALPLRRVSTKTLNAKVSKGLVEKKASCSNCDLILSRGSSIHDEITNFQKKNPNNCVLNTNPENIFNMMQVCQPVSVLHSVRSGSKKFPRAHVPNEQFIQHVLGQYSALVTGMKLAPSTAIENFHKPRKRVMPFPTRPMHVNTALTDRTRAPQKEPLYQSPWHETFNKPQVVPPDRGSSIGIHGAKSSRNFVRKNVSNRSLSRAGSEVSSFDGRTSRNSIQSSQTDLASLRTNREIVLRKQQSTPCTDLLNVAEKNTKNLSPVGTSVFVEMDSTGYKISRVRGKDQPGGDDYQFPASMPTTLIQGVFDQTEKAKEKREMEEKMRELSAAKERSDSSLSSRSVHSYLRHVRRRLKKYAKKMKEEFHESSSASVHTSMPHVHFDHKTKGKKRKKRKKKTHKIKSNDHWRERY